MCTSNTYAVHLVMFWCTCCVLGASAAPNGTRSGSVVAGKGSTCVLVGNGPDVLKSEVGNIIDQHDVVARLNFAPLQGWSKHVGSSTTVVFSNPYVASRVLGVRKMNGGMKYNRDSLRTSPKLVMTCLFDGAASKCTKLAMKVCNTSRYRESCFLGIVPKDRIDTHLGHHTAQSKSAVESFPVPSTGHIALLHLENKSSFLPFSCRCVTLVGRGPSHPIVCRNNTIALRKDEVIKVVNNENERYDLTNLAHELSIETVF